MLSPPRLTQLFVEIIFMLLGALVIWLGVNERINFDRHGTYWLVLGAGVAAWGLLALAKPGEWWARWQKWNRAGSLILLGLLMVAITRVPFAWVSTLLAACGVVLLVRGALGSLLILKPR